MNRKEYRRLKIFFRDMEPSFNSFRARLGDDTLTSRATEYLACMLADWIWQNRPGKRLAPCDPKMLAYAGAFTGLHWEFSMNLVDIEGEYFMSLDIYKFSLMVEDAHKLAELDMGVDVMKHHRPGFYLQLSKVPGRGAA